MYKYRSWKGDSIYLESSAGSREYMLIYFWGMGTYFIWGWKHIFNGGIARRALPASGGKDVVGGDRKSK